ADSRDAESSSFSSVRARVIPSALVVTAVVGVAVGRLLHRNRFGETGISIDEGQKVNIARTL
ncbi:MAG: hypothetical protein OES47_11245, partial [Acidobacteriota bacterium]|nr:hypothetical protein [Acidobacteriota bacterium]